MVNRVTLLVVSLLCSQLASVASSGDYIYVQYGTEKSGLVRYNIKEDEETLLTELPACFFAENISLYDNREVLISGYIIEVNHYADPQIKYREYSASYDINTKRTEVLTEEIIVTDYCNGNLLGMHNYGRDLYSEENPFFRDYNSDRSRVIFTLDPLNLQVVEISGGELTRLTFTDYNARPKYLNDDTIIYYTHDGHSGAIAIMNRDGFGKFSISIDDKYVTNEEDLNAYKYGYYADSIYIVNDHYLLTTEYEEYPDGYKQVTGLDELYHTDDEILDLSIDDKGDIYMLVGSGPRPEDIYITIYDPVERETKVIYPSVYIKTPFAVIP
jgi:hypothetical protein